MRSLLMAVLIPGSILGLDPDAIADQVTQEAASQDLQQATSLPASSPVSLDLKSDFPRPAAVDPRMSADPYQEYDRDTLYDYIDGGAEVYLDLGFVKVGARDYILDLAEETYVTLDVYDMGHPTGAYGIFCAERYADTTPVSIGAGGWIGGGSLVFWAGRCYVKIRADDDTSEVNGILRKIAGLVIACFEGPFEPPAETRLFPERDRVAASERYVAQNLLGLSFLGGFSSGYGKGKSRLVMTLTHFPRGPSARTAYAKLARRLGLLTPVRSSVDGASISLVDFAGGALGRGKVLQAGRFLGLIRFDQVGPEDRAWADALVDEMRRRVEKAVAKERSDGVPEKGAAGRRGARGVKQGEGPPAGECRVGI